MSETALGRRRVRWIVPLLAAAMLVGAMMCFLLSRCDVWPDTEAWHGVGRWLSEWIRTPGFGGAAAVVAAAIAYAGVRRNARVQREASRKEQWWDRAKWALDLTLSNVPEEREVGYAMLDALADSEWAQEHESDVIAAATEPALATYQAQQNDAIDDMDVDEAHYVQDEEEAADAKEHEADGEGHQDGEDHEGRDADEDRRT